MKKYNAKNVRMIRKFSEHMEHGLGLSKATITGFKRAAKEFQKTTRFADFATFDREQALKFKEDILQANKSKSTLLHYMNDLKRFFEWLAFERGYKSKIDVRDTDYFRISRKEMNAIKSEAYKPFATLEQMQTAIRAMPSDTIIHRRDRAVMSLGLLTGARDKALSMARISDIDIRDNLFKPTEGTKNSKYIQSYFITAVGKDILGFFTDYYHEIKGMLLYGNDDPLFPKTCLEQDINYNFTAQGLSKEFWADAAPTRKIFKKAFEALGMPYFPPHRVRKTLTHFAEQTCRTPEEFKAFSQNLGHKSPLTTFGSYGGVSHHRQSELIKNLGQNANKDANNNDTAEMKAMLAQLLEKQK